MLASPALLPNAQRGHETAVGIAFTERAFDEAQRQGVVQFVGTMALQGIAQLVGYTHGSERLQNQAIVIRYVERGEANDADTRLPSFTSDKKDGRYIDAQYLHEQKPQPSSWNDLADWAGSVVGARQFTEVTLTDFSIDRPTLARAYAGGLLDGQRPVSLTPAANGLEAFVKQSFGDFKSSKRSLWQGFSTVILGVRPELELIRKNTAIQSPFTIGRR